MRANKLNLNVPTLANREIIFSVCSLPKNNDAAVDCSNVSASVPCQSHVH